MLWKGRKLGKTEKRGVRQYMNGGILHKIWGLEHLSQLQVRETQYYVCTFCLMDMGNYLESILVFYSKILQKIQYFSFQGVKLHISLALGSI